MINAIERTPLVHVLDEWRARARWAESGSTRATSDLDDTAKRALIPRFIPIVKDLVSRGWLEVSERPIDRDGARVLAGEALDAALVDPSGWIWCSDDSLRLLGLATTDRWSRHVTEPVRHA
jgi:hypothetical protein